ncbi:homeobox-leucine zipper hdg11 [Trichoderma arundinaceum]|uniref:Homeobox-leucine zipper hdg11 n=1 Tax=Trichoderma arundinaceum TaxID=490622 RepID=A0A395NA15_TRIAR|nr:homeobox-leucine zipper hdg11 [Trichoderma arundinaceum]
MLATRSCDTEHSHWSFGKYFSAPGKASTGPRMSDQYDASLPTQPDWQGQYPYPPQPAGSVYSQSSESNHASSAVIQPLPVVESENLRLEAQAARQPALPPNSNHNLYRIGTEATGHPFRTTESLERKEESRGLKTASLLLDESLAPARTAAGVSAPSNHTNPASTMAKSLGNHSDRFASEDQPVAVSKDDADDALIDEDMAEEEADSLLQSTAERVAARRKMKRFR